MAQVPEIYQQRKIHDIDLVSQAESGLPTLRVNLCGMWTPTQIYATISFHVYFDSIIKLALFNGYHAMFVIHSDKKTRHKIDISHNSRSWNSKVVVMNAHICFETIEFYLKCIPLWATTWWHENVFAFVTFFYENPPISHINEPLWGSHRCGYPSQRANNSEFDDFVDVSLNKVLN